MNLTNVHRTDVFADWLDVTCSPDDSFIDSVQYAVDSCGGVIKSVDQAGRTDYSLGAGVVRLQVAKTFHKVSFSGASLSHLRDSLKLDLILCAISEVPHSITRLDVALDTDQDGADVFSHYQRLYSKSANYPRLSRKSVIPTYFSSRRDSDGRVTGTVNIGMHRGTKVSARIYDKQHESLQKRSDSIPSRTRYELTVRKDMGPSLRDVSEPTGIFWHYMGNNVLKRLKDAPKWESGWGGAWTMQVEKPLLYQVLKTKIQGNPELLRIFELADSMSPDGRVIAMNLIKRTHTDFVSLTQDKLG